jgi:hypothetical protein
MNPKEDLMKCCDSSEKKVAQEGGTKLSWLARLGIVGTVLTCIACFTPLAVTLLGVIGLAGWAGYLDYILFPLLAVCVGLLLVWVCPQTARWKTERRNLMAREIVVYSQPG